MNELEALVVEASVKTCFSDYTSFRIRRLVQTCYMTHISRPSLLVLIYSVFLFRLLFLLLHTFSRHLSVLPFLQFIFIFYLSVCIHSFSLPLSSLSLLLLLHFSFLLFSILFHLPNFFIIFTLHSPSFIYLFVSLLSPLLSQLLSVSLLVTPLFFPLHDLPSSKFFGPSFFSCITPLPPSLLFPSFPPHLHLHSLIHARPSSSHLIFPFIPSSHFHSPVCLFYSPFSSPSLLPYLPHSLMINCFPHCLPFSISSTFLSLKSCTSFPPSFISHSPNLSLHIFLHPFF